MEALWLVAFFIQIAAAAGAEMLDDEKPIVWVSGFAMLSVKELQRLKTEVGKRK